MAKYQCHFTISGYIGCCSSLLVATAWWQVASTFCATPRSEVSHIFIGELGKSQIHGGFLFKERGVKSAASANIIAINEGGGRSAGRAAAARGGRGAVAYLTVQIAATLRFGARQGQCANRYQCDVTRMTAARPSHAPVATATNHYK